MTEQELYIVWNMVWHTRHNEAVKSMTDDDLAKWVALQLAEAVEFYTIPRGMLHLTPATKEEYLAWMDSKTD